MRQCPSFLHLLPRPAAQVYAGGSCFLSAVRPPYILAEVGRGGICTLGGEAAPSSCQLTACWAIWLLGGNLAVGRQSGCWVWQHCCAAAG